MKNFAKLYEPVLEIPQLTVEKSSRFRGSPHPPVYEYSELSDSPALDRPHISNHDASLCFLTSGDLDL